MPQLHLHAEEVVLSLVRIRRKQLAMAAAVEAARDAAADGSDTTSPIDPPDIVDP